MTGLGRCVSKANGNDTGGHRWQPAAFCCLPSLPLLNSLKSLCFGDMGWKWEDEGHWDS